jgi:hypothetical protein
MLALFLILLAMQQDYLYKKTVIILLTKTITVKD